MIERCFTEITNVNEKDQVLTYLTFFGIRKKAINDVHQNR
jgi:hypothetical protein